MCIFEVYRHIRYFTLKNKFYLILRTLQSSMISDTLQLRTLRFTHSVTILQSKMSKRYSPHPIH